MEIVKITAPDEKSAICNAILRALPDWFGIDSAIVDYCAAVREMPFYVVDAGGRIVGFVAIRVHSAYTAEVYVMGVAGECHRAGLGRRLIAQCEQFCAAHAMEFLTVKTLDETAGSAEYDGTRAFYLACGFRPLECFPTLWDAHNPCLMLCKYVK